MPGGMFGVGASSLILHGRRLKNTLSPRHQGERTPSLSMADVTVDYVSQSS
ncbi:rCG53664 [Rattus norvegicus]|uniref:RCG53664 n=1 Tax=Rattus norvegicus TaxID=10116 RepID=A6J9T9_RAT|nr:rCG53664 [Rattus norvegicus]